ncbi:MAG: RNA-guided endonuclease InsQ/TnpB family protein, partial [Leptodesmis sp.]|uniref:RNA-guided endonuclease InsQ/TnpB family protein n=1 Tax=Leptodesmis sp. TaxID=3100501 RepID=UPI003D13C59E
MLNLTYSYRIYPGLDQEAQMLDWLEQCRRVYNYALVERKDWINSRKCLVNACSIRQESIIPADAPYPDYFKASGWYAQLILQADVSVPEPVPHGEPIGIDLGLEKFLAVSTGELVERPRFFTDLQSQLRWLQRKLRNKQKGSANYRKAQAKIRSLHEHIHNVRRDFHFLTAHRLCDRAGMIFAEDLNLKMTSRGILAKHCLDAAWGSFLEILQW